MTTTTSLRVWRMAAIAGMSIATLAATSAYGLQLIRDHIGESQAFVFDLIIAGETLVLLVLLLAEARKFSSVLTSGFDTLTAGISGLAARSNPSRLPTEPDDEFARIAAECNRLADHLAESTRLREQTEREIQMIKVQLTDHSGALEARNVTIEMMGRMASRLQTALGEDEFATVVARYIPQILAGSAGALYLLNANGDLLHRLTTWNDPGELPESYTPDQCWALRRIPGPTSVPIRLPLLAQGEIVGLLHLQRGSTTDSDGFDPVGILGEAIALAAVNQRLRTSLKEQALRDPLTGLFNRRYLEEALVLEFARADRSRLPLGIVMVDIDHFKRIDDSFGRDACGGLLRDIGQCLLAQVRGGDIVCRYSGDDFTVILPGADAAQAAERAETLRQAVASLTPSYQGESLGPVTISLGVAAAPQHGNTPASVLAAADRGLRSAKSAGRNRVQTGTSA